LFVTHLVFSVHPPWCCSTALFHNCIIQLGEGTWGGPGLPVTDIRQGPRVGSPLEHPLKYPGTTNKLNPSPKTEDFLIS